MLRDRATRSRGRARRTVALGWSQLPASTARRVAATASGLLFEPAVGEADRAVAALEMACVAGAVGVEGVPGLVVAPAVDLDDEALLGDEEVDLLAGELAVDGRPRQAVAAADGEEEVLEVRAGHRAGEVRGDRRPERSGSAVARMGSSHGIEGGVVGQFEDLRAVERAVEGVGVEGRREVEDRAGRGRDADAVFDGQLGAAERPDPVDLDLGSRRAAGVGRDDDVDARGVAAADAPEGRGRGAEEGGRVAAREDRRHPSPVAGQARVAHRVDAAVQPMQPPRRDAPIDRVVGEPKAAQLAAGDDTVLVARELRDGAVDRGRGAISASRAEFAPR